MEQLVTNYAIYEDGIEYLGAGDVTFPEINHLVEEITGAGLNGPIEAVVVGHLEAMTCTINFNTVSDAAIKLSEPRMHNIDCRVAQQGMNNRTGMIEQGSVKHVLRMMPKKFVPGKAAVASPAAM